MLYIFFLYEVFEIWLCILYQQYISTPTSLVSRTPWPIVTSGCCWGQSRLRWLCHIQPGVPPAADTQGSYSLHSTLFFPSEGSPEVMETQKWWQESLVFWGLLIGNRKGHDSKRRRRALATGSLLLGNLAKSVGWEAGQRSQRPSAAYPPPTPHHPSLAWYCLRLGPRPWGHSQTHQHRDLNLVSKTESREKERY